VNLPFTNGEVMSTSSLATCLGSTSALARQGPFSMGEAGPLGLETTKRQPCRLPLIIAVNTAMIGLVVSVMIAAIELGIHVLS